MRKLCSPENTVMAGHIRSLLADHGIEVVVRNEFLSGAAGELPPNECWPEVWLPDDRHFDAAMALVEAISTPTDGGALWHCPGCEESVESQFTACWNCGCERPHPAGPEA